MKKAIVFSNWGDWDEDAIGCTQVLEVPDHPLTRDDLVLIAKGVVIEGTSAENPDVQEVDGALVVLNEHEMLDIINEQCLSYYVNVDIHYRARVYFQNSVDMFLMIHVLEC